jgi:hypothetical protein
LRKELRTNQERKTTTSLGHDGRCGSGREVEGDS